MTINHPGWCTPDRCTARDDDNPYLRGEHRSAPVQVDVRRVFTNGGPVPATIAFLSKAHCPWNVDTFLRLVTGDEDMAIPNGQALAGLAALSALAGQGEP